MSSYMVPPLALGIPVKGVHTVWLASSVVKRLLLCGGPQCVGVGVGGCVRVYVFCGCVCVCMDLYTNIGVAL